MEVEPTVSLPAFPRRMVGWMLDAVVELRFVGGVGWWTPVSHGHGPIEKSPGNLKAGDRFHTSDPAGGKKRLSSILECDPSETIQSHSKAPLQCLKSRPLEKVDSTPT